MDILEELNQRQREAVEVAEGPLLILAGPGSGKTRVITHRIAYLVRECGVSPHRIAAVTFTKKAAREMKERLERLLGPRAQELTTATFHAFCASVLRREGQHVGLDRAFVIYDQDDQLEVLKGAMEEAEIDPKRYTPRAVLSAISAAKSQLLDDESYGAMRSNPWEGVVHRAYQRYQEMLQRSNAVDFDDLLLKTYFLFRDNVHVVSQYQMRYLHLLIDEFQDTNVAQYAIARLLAAKHRNICVVGDPDQSIYSWRNADIRNILSFQQDYPEALLVTLDENYRSTETILEAARGVISANNQRIDKSLWTRNPRGKPVVVGEAYNPEEEAQQVLREIERLKRDEGYSLGDCAVMYRVNAQSRALEDGCLRYAVPYRLIGGLRFYQRKEVKDLVAYLRLVLNPYDEVSLARVINVPPRGIGQHTLDQLTRMARSRGIPLYAAMQLIVEHEEGDSKNHPLAARTSRAVERFLHLLNGLMEEGQRLPVAELLDAVLERIGYKSHLMEDGEQGRERWENVQELCSTAMEFQQMAPQEGLSAFLEGVALVSDVDSLEENKEAITLITLHQAKGLEFPVVFIVGLEDGLLPHIRSFDDAGQMEEERRLFYVGMTRARDRLYLMRAFRRGFRGNSGPGPSRPSRFLGDIPPHLVSSLATAGQGIAPPGQSLGGRTGPPKEDGPVTARVLLKAGERVRHSKFGEGIVISCVPSGQDHEVTVAFKGNSGIKKLLLGYAPLEKVD
ncbi:MAG: ATP-dependent helicase UvrD/PcrA [Dehalococcoidia bacterium]|nr:ATP-dependent helicase UvrD/PcrA [Dehalococcoidia bacterium]